MIRSHEDLVWDDTSKDTLGSKRSLSPSTHAWRLDTPSEDENGFDVDKAFDYDPNRWSEDNPIEDDWSGDDLLALERPHDPEERQFQPRHGIDSSPNPLDAYDMEWIAPPPVLDFEDDDPCLDPSLRSAWTGYHVLEESASESDLFQDLMYDYITCEGDPIVQNSRDTVGRPLELGDRFPATRSLAYLRLPSISGLLSNQEGRHLLGKQKVGTLYGSQLQAHTAVPYNVHKGDNFNMYGEENTTRDLISFSHDPLDNDENLDLNVISDTDSNISAHRETTLEENRDLDKDRGVSVAIVARPYFPEASNSNNSPTLSITCPHHRDLHRQLSDSREELEDSDEELCRGEAIGDSAQIAYFREDILAVVGSGDES